jgi:cell division septum initiation protein DivIVA
MVEDTDNLRQPAHSAGTLDFANVLDELVEIIERAKSMPLSSSAIISRDEVLDLLSAAREALPAELSRARRVLQDREELIAQAGREAAGVLDDARAQAAHMVERTEIVRQARAHADRLLADAEADARRARHEADDYVDRKLAQFEIVLDRTIRTVQAGRERLTVVPEESEKPGGQEAGNEEGLFDQDLA